MINAPWLSMLWLLPLAGAIATIVMPARRRESARWLGISVSVAVFAVALALAAAFSTGGPTYQFTESRPWIPAFGATYTLGVDGVALALVLLTTFLVPLLLIAAWNDGGAHPRGPQAYVALTLTAESMVLISLISLDLLLFYVFFEAMLIPMYFLIGMYGDRRRSRAAVTFLVYNLFGGLVMFAAVIFLYAVTAKTGQGTFDFRELVVRVHNVHHDGLRVVFLGFMFAFAIKAPLCPVHTWLPSVASEANTATAVLMMAVVDKVGTFGMLRYCLQLFPELSTYFRPGLITLSVVSIVYGAIVAIGQTDIMRLICYASISHFGFIVLGIFVMTTQGHVGSVLYMVNHGISTAALMLVAGFLTSRGGTRAIAGYGGVQQVAPLLAGTFLVSGLATLALPGLATFVSEFLVLVGSFVHYPVAAAVAASSLVLSSIYVLWLYQRTMTGPVTYSNTQLKDLGPRELAVVVPLIASLVVFGCYPKPLLVVINPTVSHGLSGVAHQK